MRNKSFIKNALMKATALHVLYMSSDFQNYFLPYLKEMATVDYVNPRDFKTIEDYQYALDAANREAGIYKELLSFFDRQKGVMEKLNTELKKEEVSYSL